MSRTDGELLAVAKGMISGEVISSLQISITGVDLGSPIYAAKLTRAICTMFPTLFCTTEVFAMAGRAAMYYALAKDGARHSDDGTPVFRVAQWLDDGEFRRMWEMCSGVLGDLPEIGVNL